LYKYFLILYFDKYLKYKNKYLDLKNAVGGRKNENESEKNYKKYKDVWNSKNPMLPKYKINKDLSKFFDSYCWVPSSKSLGIFLFKINPLMGPNVEEIFEERFKVIEYTGVIKKGDYDKYPSYAIYNILPDNIGPLYPFPEGIKPQDEIKNKTPFELKYEDINIEEGSLYGYHHGKDSNNNYFIFKPNNSNNYYFANINI